MFRLVIIYNWFIHNVTWTFNILLIHKWGKYNIFVKVAFFTSCVVTSCLIHICKWMIIILYWMKHYTIILHQWTIFLVFKIVTWNSILSVVLFFFILLIFRNALKYYYCKAWNKYFFFINFIYTIFLDYYSHTKI